MKDDTIKRSDAIKAILQKPAIHGSEGSWYHADDIRDALNAVPSADRPQGKWIHEIDDMGIYRQHAVRCSNCKCGFTNAYVVLLCGDTGDLFRYCPSCGARMKGADDE